MKLSSYILFVLLGLCLSGCQRYPTVEDVLAAPDCYKDRTLSASDIVFQIAPGSFVVPSLQLQQLPADILPWTCIDVITPEGREFELFVDLRNEKLVGKLEKLATGMPEKAAIIYKTKGSNSPLEGDLVLIDIEDSTDEGQVPPVRRAVRG